jgi:hypothetical protein
LKKQVKDFLKNVNLLGEEFRVSKGSKRVPDKNKRKQVDKDDNNNSNSNNS